MRQTDCLVFDVATLGSRSSSSIHGELSWVLPHTSTPRTGLQTWRLNIFQFHPRLGIHLRMSFRPLPQFSGQCFLEVLDPLIQDVIFLTQEYTICKPTPWLPYLRLPFERTNDLSFWVRSSSTCSIFFFSQILLFLWNSLFPPRLLFCYTSWESLAEPWIIFL